MTPPGGDATPGVDQLRQEVQSLRQDVNTIRSTMQEMHREVGSAVLLLSRFVGLQWNADEALRLAEEKTASASEAVHRLSDNVGNLEQRLTTAEEPQPEGGKGQPADGGGRGGAKPTHPSPAGTERVAHEAKFAEGGDGGSTPPDDTGDGIVSSPSLSQVKSPETAAGTAPVPREAEVGAKRTSSDREVRSDQTLQQASTAESIRNQRLSSSSRKGAEEESGEDVASPSDPGRSDDDLSVGVGDGDGEESEGSSASSAAGPGRRHNGALRRDIDSDGDHASSRIRSSGESGNGGDRRKDGPSRSSIDGHPIDRPLPDPAAEPGVSSLSSSRPKEGEQVLQRPSASRLSPLRRSRDSVVADGVGGSNDTVGTNLNPASEKGAAGGAAVITVLSEDERAQAASVGGGDLGVDTNDLRLPVSADDSTLSSSRTEEEQPARQLSAATLEASSEVLPEIVDGEVDQDRGELKTAVTRENTSAVASEEAAAGGATPAVAVASKVDSSVRKQSAMGEEDGRKNEPAGSVEESAGGGARPTDDEALKGAAVSPSRDRTSVSATPRPDELALSTSARKETLAMDQNGVKDTHDSGRGQDEEKETTPCAKAQVDAAQETGTTTPVVLARGSKSDSALVGSPGAAGGGGSAVQIGADEKKPNRDTGDEGRVRGDGEHGRSIPAAGEPGSVAASLPATLPPGNEAHGNSSSQGFLQPGPRTFDAPKAASSSIKLDPLEPRSTGRGGAEGLAEVSETVRSTGRTHGSISQDARDAKTRVSKEVESGEGAERSMSSRRVSARGQKAGSTATPSRNTEAGLAPVVPEASEKRGDNEDGSRSGRSFSDDSSHTSGGSSSTSRTGDSRPSNSEQGTVAFTRADSLSEKGRAADSSPVKRSNSDSSGGRRRRSRSRSKSQVPADGVVGCIAGREDAQGAQIGDHQPKVVTVNDKRRSSGQYVHADAASVIAAAAAARPPRGFSLVPSPTSAGPGVEDHELEASTDNDG